MGAVLAEGGIYNRKKNKAEGGSRAGGTSSESEITCARGKAASMLAQFRRGGAAVAGLALVSDAACSALSLAELLRPSLRR